MITYSDRQPVLNRMAQSEMPDVTKKSVSPRRLLSVDGVVAMQVEPADELHKGDELPAVGVAGEHEIDARGSLGIIVMRLMVQHDGVARRIQPPCQLSHGCAAAAEAQLF